MALGEILKQKRLARNWTREYVAERTHLMARVIEALETENFRKIPAPVYGRGFIRQYCALLEIDPQPLLDEYAAAVSGGSGRTAVTRPAVHDLPARPVEPIHTGGHKTLPPKEKTPPAPIASTHKSVAPAEDSFTAVPKPEMCPQAGPPAPAPAQTPLSAGPASVAPSPAKAEEPETFTLDGGAIPPEPPVPAKKPRRATEGRAALADLSVRPAAAHGQGIFGPQHPVPDPVSPSMRTLRSLGATVMRLCATLVTHLTRPKVRRMGDAHPEPLLSRRTLQRMACVVGVLLALTFVALVFRYVFRLSSTAESELGVAAVPAAGDFSPRPVAPPPPPYFK